MQAPDAQTISQAAPEVTSELSAPAKDSVPTIVEREPAPDTSAVVDDFELPLKKKRRRLVCHCM